MKVIWKLSAPEILQRPDTGGLLFSARAQSAPAPLTILLWWPQEGGAPPGVVLRLV